MSRARQLADSADLAFDGNTLKIDSTNNRVGIGTSSPNVKVQIGDGTSNQNLSIDGGSGTAEGAVLAIRQGGSYKGVLGTTAVIDGAGTNSDIRLQSYSDNIDIRAVAAKAITFDTSNTERMRIDSNGSVLTGKTSNNLGIAGSSLQFDGFVGACRDGNAPFGANRLSSDGDIMFFQKDGTTVGSIGVSSSRLYIAPPSGYGVKVAGNDVRPVTSAGANSDGNLDLGTSFTRFKDLYLSGGVYLGGTGSANYLDDYEEGTWTPTLTPNAGSGYTFTVNHATYTKVGRVVTLVITFTTTTVGTASGGLNINGKPFTALASAAMAGEIMTTGGLYAGYVSSGGGLIYTYPGTYVNGYSYTISATYFTS